MDIFLETTFWPLRGAAITRVTGWPRLSSPSPMGTGSPPPKKKLIAKNLKFGLKLSVWASITSGLVGISSPKFSRRRGELWSTNEKGMRTNIDTPEVLVHCSPKLTQFHMPRGSRVQFSGVIRHCERNFEYLNWQSTRYCGAGRPHVGLCHAFLVCVFFLQPPVRRMPVRKAVIKCSFFYFFYLMRNLWNGRKYGAKYGRTKDLTGKELSVSFADIRPGVFPGGPKNWAKSTRFRT